MDDLVVGLTECTLCTEPMTSPKFLPCFHCFCRKCLEKLCGVHEENGIVPCPLCRSTFDIPTKSDCRRLPSNVYAEELVRVSGIVREANKKHLLVQDELEAAKNRLTASEAEAAEEKCRRETDLADTRSRLEDRCSQVEELKRNLLDAESREAILRERQRGALEQLRAMEMSCAEAKKESESFGNAKTEAEACLAVAKESYEKLSVQLQQARRETSERTSSMQSELGKSQQEVESLKGRLATTADHLRYVSALSGKFIHLLCPVP